MKDVTVGFLALPKSVEVFPVPRNQGWPAYGVITLQSIGILAFVLLRLMMMMGGEIRGVVIELFDATHRKC